MGQWAVRCESLGKRYIVGHRIRYMTLREDVQGLGRRIAERVTRRERRADTSADFWALRGVSLEVSSGEVVGLIGRNGAGKSTLLRILARITVPTEGRAEIRGRVGSLLEVGTGFHPELTGRENIFLNGAIIGMSRREVRTKFDEIVAFSEVERFLDTPVKRYSSGMYVRLAFAVAAHLEPEVLLVDEVLAVGDAAFQQKCLGRMSDIAHSGRTVFFVSHNIGAVSRLCTTAIMLDEGHVVARGAVDDVVQAYLSEGAGSTGERDLSGVERRSGSGRARVSRIGTYGTDCSARGVFYVGDTMRLQIALRCAGRVPSLRFTVSVVDDRGWPAFHFENSDSGFAVADVEDGDVLDLEFEDQRLYPGTYSVSVWLGAVETDEMFDEVQDCLTFSVSQGGGLATRTLARHAGSIFVTPRCRKLGGGSREGQDTRCENPEGAGGSDA